MQDKVFDAFRARLRKESLIKSILCGLIAGFTALLISCAVFWFVDFKAVWVGGIIAVAVCAAAVPVFFFTLFRPSDKALARRMDALGLEERVITMRELEGNDSFMAQRQREDAVAAIKKVDAKLIKIAISIPLCIALGLSVVLGSGMSVVCALSASDIIRSGNEIINDVNKPAVGYFTIEYDVEGPGYIEGDLVQIVEEGGSTGVVLAVAEDGFVFDHWEGSYIGEDGYTYEIDELPGYDNPSRVDTKVDRDMIIVAVFVEVDDGSGSGMPGEGEGDGDSDSDAPGEGEGQGQGNSPNNSNGDPNKGAGGQYDDAGNQIIDGDTYYGGDTLDNAYEDAMDSLGENDADRGTIGDYFDIIQD